MDNSSSGDATRREYRTLDGEGFEVVIRSKKSHATIYHYIDDPADGEELRAVVEGDHEGVPLCMKNRRRSIATTYIPKRRTVLRGTYRLCEDCERIADQLEAGLTR